MRKKIRKTVIAACLFVLGSLFCAPILYLLSGSVMSRYELTQSLTPVIAGGEEMICWNFFPLYPTFEHYMRVLLLTPQFFVV